MSARVEVRGFPLRKKLMQNPNRNGQLRFSDLLVLLALAGTIVGGLLTL